MTATVSTPASTYDVHALRAEEFPFTRESVYVNNAAIGPIPMRAARAVAEFCAKRSAPHTLPDTLLFDTLARSRELAARLINAHPDEIALAGNTTYGLNVAAFGLPLEAGDIVVASDREFPANIYPWAQLAERGVTLEIAPTTAEGWPDEAHLLERVRDPRVKVLAVSLVQFSNGYRVDLDRLSRATREHGTYLVVDAIQALGQLPVDVRKTPVDVLAAGAFKWLLSPWGSGFFYVRKELQERLRPPMIGWLAFEGSEDYSRLTEYMTELRPNAQRYELITLGFQDFAGMNAALELLLELDPARIERHIARVVEPFHTWAARRGEPLASPVGASGSGITCVRVDDPARVHAELKAHGVVHSMRAGCLRFSPHAYNTVEEVERIVGLLG